MSKIEAGTLISIIVFFLGIADRIWTVNARLTGVEEKVTYIQDKLDSIIEIKVKTG